MTTKRDQIESLITLWARGDSSRTAADLTDGIRAILAEPNDAMLTAGSAVSISETFDTTDDSTYRWVSENDARNIWADMLTAAWRAPA